MMKLEVDPDVFRSFAFYGGILAAKMLFMSLLTGKHRMTKKVFANPEDVAMDPKNGKLTLNDPDVERVRRAHLNDLENILPYFFTGFLYCFTNPEVTTAKLIFRVFTAVRFMHTFVYAIVPMQQPSRGLAWTIGYFINLYMVFKVITHFY